jgi:hypothetical protein
MLLLVPGKADWICGDKLYFVHLLSLLQTLEPGQHLSTDGLAEIYSRGSNFYICNRVGKHQQNVYNATTLRDYKLHLTP